MTTQVDAEVPLRRRVAWGDTDHAGVVFFANYLRYFEEAEVSAMKAWGADPGPLFRERGIGFVRRLAHGEYEAPAYYDDVLEIMPRLVRLGAHSLRWHFGATRLPESKVIARGYLVTVCVRFGERFSRVAIPEDIAELLRPHVEPEGMPRLAPD
jgi:acyl-CoA thioester hydrolase